MDHNTKTFIITEVLAVCMTRVRYSEQTPSIPLQDTWSCLDSTVHGMVLAYLGVGDVHAESEL